jgi:ATP-dependent RNA helicase DeaD
MNIVTFDDLGLSAPVIEAITKMEYATPSPIQAECIPLILSGSDIIGQAQTGTGKTAAFAIPIVERVKPEVRGVQFIVICPTRELVMQVEQVIRQVSSTKSYVKSTAIVGGQPYDRQISALRGNPQIVVGTPGRLLDHLSRKTLILDTVEAVIIDEADEMLDRGFLEDIEAILSATGSQKQIVLFSATMPPRIIDLTRKYQKDPVHVNISPKNVLGTTISQGYYAVTEDSKTPLLHLLLKAYNPKLTLVFCKTKAKASDVATALQAVGVATDALHGDISQAQRNDVMRKFRSGLITVLVATDVAARGIDIENIEMVVNYDIPFQAEHYVHRIGRTGRAGRSGRSVSFILGREQRRLREIEMYTKSTIDRLELPSFGDIKRARFDGLVDSIAEKAAEPLNSDIEKTIAALVERGIAVEQIAGALLAMQKELLFGDLKPVGSIQLDQGQRRERSSYDRPREGGYRKPYGGGGGGNGGGYRPNRFSQAPGGAKRPAPSRSY